MGGQKMAPTQTQQAQPISIMAVPSSIYELQPEDLGIRSVSSGDKEQCYRGEENPHPRNVFECLALKNKEQCSGCRHL